MAEELNNAINTIQGYIDEIIADLIKLRSRHIDIASRIITQLKTLVDDYRARLRYGMKKLYDVVNVIETPWATMAETYAPQITLQYRGPLMTLETPEGEKIDVPQVDVFVFEPVSGPLAMGQGLESSISTYILLRIPKGQGVTPSQYTFEDVTSYYIRLPLSAVETSTPYFMSYKPPYPTAFAFPGLVVTVDEIVVYSVYIFAVDEFFGPDSHAFCSIDYGKLKLTVEGQTVEEIGGAFYCRYEGPEIKHSWILFGQDVGMGQLYESDTERYYFRSGAWAIIMGKPTIIIWE